MSNIIKIIDQDIIFLSYDEPNAEKNYADLLSKAPWAKRVHGVKGSDAAHKACAKLSDTEYFVTVDADNIIDPTFLEVEIDLSSLGLTSDNVFSWCGRVHVNSLMYGNGGLKLWTRKFVNEMKTHENSDPTDVKGKVEFCFDDRYYQFNESYSESFTNATPFQSWRAGFREGVKMVTKNGVLVPVTKVRDEVYWHNLHRLKIWSTVGAHEQNGLYAIYGARLGQWMTNCTQWNYVDVRDFEMLKAMYFQYGKPYEDDNDIGLVDEIKSLGKQIKQNMGFDYPYLDVDQSKYTLDLYEETINLTNTYLR
jgi:hypothetical protein